MLGGRTSGGASMNVLRMSIPPLPRFAATARRAFSNFARFHRVQSADAQHLLFAVGEALANAIQHSESTEPIELVASTEANSLVVRVTDRGRGFAAGNRTVALPHALAESGRGFAIMQRCTDFFAVESRPGCGTVVTLGRNCRAIEEPGGAS